MTYELWDMATGNIVDAADNAAAILLIVREYLTEDGPEYLEDLAFRAIDNDGNTVEKLIGADLVARVSTTSPA